MVETVVGNNLMVFYVSYVRSIYLFAVKIVSLDYVDVKSYYVCFTCGSFPASSFKSFYSPHPLKALKYGSNNVVERQMLLHLAHSGGHNRVKKI